MLCILLSFIFFTQYCESIKLASFKSNENMAEKEEKEKKYNFSKNIEDYGYAFNENGQLRSIDGKDQPYQFEVEEGNRDYNQKRYEALGEVVTDYVYRLMEKDLGLKRIYLPLDAKKGQEPRTFFFMSENVMENADKLLILIHGSGAVRAGQWARRLIINDCLETGTQLPFITWALENGYGVIVANPNLNTLTIRGEEKDIRGNSSPEEHINTLWEKFVSKSDVKHIAIVAHSYGGVCTLELVKKNIDQFHKMVFAIALTDSVHGFGMKRTPDKVKRFYKERCRNWASSFDELDTPLQNRMDFCPTVSAGTERHDYTSYSSMKSIFKFLDEKLLEALGKNKDESGSRTEDKEDEDIDVEKEPEMSQTGDPMSQDLCSNDIGTENMPETVKNILATDEVQEMINFSDDEPMSQCDGQKTDEQMDSQKDE